MANPKACMNVICGRTCMSTDWKHGWTLPSGGFATLCDKCGSMYEQLIFCDVFHSEESGWRECVSCGKRLHCGCIASQSLLELCDTGGVSCKSCARSQVLQSIGTNGEQKGLGATKVDDSEQLPISMNKQPDGSTVAKVRHMQTGSNTGSMLLRQLFPSQNDYTSGSSRQIKQEQFVPSIGEIGGSCFSIANQSLNNSTRPAKVNMYDSLASVNMSFTLGIPNTSAAAGSDEREHSKTSLQGPRGRHLLPKPPRSGLTTLEANASLGPQLRMARPPAEGRGKYQLLPRYWPRITDQELQQLSGDSNSTIVPLFEKVLSASDAGRIGRLVLPKACAEAYFPPISQPEGLPLRIQDVKGKEWVFQFRFWPNNNSRMYVLEGVTPCIQSMQLQAGDTVTFSRMDPEGKLVMGFRKASSSVVIQEHQQPALQNGSHSSDAFFSGVIENLSVLNGYSGLLQTLKGTAETNISTLSKHLSSAADVIWPKNERGDEDKKELLQSIMVPDRKRTRNIGSKSKRLVIDNEDALELKLTWKEAQDLLHPPPAVTPSIVLVEDHEFEEYEEPPVFAKRSVFVLRTHGVQEQWVQCDSCSKWRRLPVDVLLPPKWTCVDNIWDQSRSSCSEPTELTPREIEYLVRLDMEFRKQSMIASCRRAQEHESSGLDALANATSTEDNMDEGDPGTASVAATTKHPRHRPGCSCIVCIQPPSGKGKHKPTCTCNVCMTVKRRFKTLMMRKKKRQSEREAELAQRNQNTWPLKDESVAESSSRHASSQTGPSDNHIRLAASESESKNQNVPFDNLADASKEQLDLNLNCNPEHEESLNLGVSSVSMTSFLRVANLPLETYMKQNGLTSLVSEQTNSASHVPLQVTGESEGQTHEEPCLTSTIQECENGEENYEPDQGMTDP